MNYHLENHNVFGSTKVARVNLMLVKYKPRRKIGWKNQSFMIPVGIKHKYQNVDN